MQKPAEMTFIVVVFSNSPPYFGDSQRMSSGNTDSSKDNLRKILSMRICKIYGRCYGTLAGRRRGSASRV
ncbi:MAG: hypothetical protein ACLUD0_07325 [Eubacterium ramulus]